MAVYTPLSNDDIQNFLSQYSLGDLISAEGIAEGIENTNYLLVTGPDRQHYILTVFERRAAPADLPFFLAFTEFLANQELPSPRPIRGTDGGSLYILKDKPAAVIEFLEGKNKPDITPRHLFLMGEMMAQMHLAASEFKLNRRNTMGMDSWLWLFDRFRAGADTINPGLEKEIIKELDWLGRHWPGGLPAAVIHADLFPDNVFFMGEPGEPVLTGIIDFYFSCTDFLMYDLMIVLNAWCFDSKHRFVPERAKALWEGYESIRPLTEAERHAAPVLGRGAAMRFLSTRAHDWLNRVENALVVLKDPMEYVEKLHFHQQIKSLHDYGL